jgi:acyl dehydratase
MNAPEPWQVVARNLAAHAGNPIHTDAGARAAGFPGALVAGVTVHAWLTHPAVVAWGDDWLGNGGGSVRFRRPVFDGALVTCRATVGDDGSLTVDALDEDPGEPRAVLVAYAPSATRAPEPLPVTERHDRLPADAAILSAVEHLGSIDAVLDGAWGGAYAGDVGDDLACYHDGTTVHPGVFLEAAHLALTRNIGLPAWIHTASTYRLHEARVPVGTAVSVRSRVLEATTRKGRDEIGCDVQLVVGDRVIVSVDHHAIIRLPA